MLKLGAKDIKALYLGERKIGKACLGDTLVYMEGKPSRLPEGYIEVEYIQSNGTQYIDTKLKVNIQLKIIMDVEPLSSGSATNKYFINSAYVTSSSGYAFRVIWNNNGVQAMMGYNSSLTYTTVNSDKTLRRMGIEMDVSNKTVTVDNKIITFSSNTISSSLSTLKLLSAGSATSNMLSAKLYSCQIYTGDSLAADYVPCIDPNGDVGLYDLVNAGFYKSAVTGQFTPGPAV